LEWFVTGRSPYITVITSTYNCTGTLQRAIDSVKKQTFQSVEHIIVDGASTDGSVDIISENSKRQGSKISYWVSEPDAGVYNAWNKALPHINGEWVIFLGADDEYSDETAFERMLPYLRQSSGPEHKIVYAKRMHVNSDGEMYKTVGEPIEKMKGFYGTNLLTQPPHSTTFQHRSLFENYSFDERFKIGGDTDFILEKLNRDNCKALFVDEVIHNFYDGGLSSDPDLAEQRDLEIEMIMRKLLNDEEYFKRQVRRGICIKSNDGQV